MPAAKSQSAQSAATSVDPVTAILRQHAETQFATELAALREADDRQRPPNWRLSPWAVATYLFFFYSGGPAASTNGSF